MTAPKTAASHCTELATRPASPWRPHNHYPGCCTTDPPPPRRPPPKPRRASPKDTKAARIRALLRDLLAEHDADGMLPTSSRFLFYELEQRGDATKISKNGTGRTHGWPPGAKDITDELTRMREEEIIPWRWIARNHLSAIMRKLGASSRIEAIRIAEEQGWL